MQLFYFSMGKFACVAVFIERLLLLIFSQSLLQIVALSRYHVFQDLFSEFYIVLYLFVLSY